MGQCLPQQRDIAADLRHWANLFEPVLRAAISPPDVVPERLAQAVRYSVESGGKRVRAFIVTRMCELCGGEAERAAPAAVAMECVHAFSLVHDDLPAMDDDDMRRGRPTTHRAFGEATAILAGDALLALAFEILATRIPEPRIASAAVAELAGGAGWAGMIGGQTRDIEAEDLPADLALVEQIHRDKTARLFQTSARLGALCATAGEAELEAAGRFGIELGRGFQIADDILDVTGSAGKMGKAVAKDATAHKQTYPAVAGLECSRAAAVAACRRAVDALAIFGPGADDLRALAWYVVQRDS